MTDDADCAPASRPRDVQQWFEGSKVADAAGQPLVVYHGTPHGDFKQFDLSRAQRDAFCSIWFTECEGQALLYALGQKKAPRSIRPVLDCLREQRPDLAAEIDAFQTTVRLITHPDGTPWECFDKEWLCSRSAAFDYAAALQEAFPGPESPRIHKAYLRAVRPYIGADETIAGRLATGTCRYDSYLSILAPYAEWAVPSLEQIWMLKAGEATTAPVVEPTFGQVHTAARLGGRWTYDLALRMARQAVGRRGVPVA